MRKQVLQKRQGPDLYFFSPFNYTFDLLPIAHIYAAAFTNVTSGKQPGLLISPNTFNSNDIFS
jgi:hypothetical protein